MQTDRDRLIELICDTPTRIMGGNMFLEKISAEIADYLLANGVIVPPCKVGQTVYIIDEGDESTEPYVLEVTVTVIGYDIGGFWITMDLPLGLKMSAHIGERSFGKTVFLTKSQAEEALKNEQEKL